MSRVLFVGELNPDIILAGVPTPGGKLRFGQAEDLVDQTVLTLGSSAAITASAAARAGASVALVAVVGDDDFGRTCLTRAAERDIDVTAVRVAPLRRTGSSVILVRAEDRGDRQILTELGTMRDLSLDDLPDALLSDAAHVHVSSFFMHVGCRDRLHERLARARALGAVISLDTNDDPERRWQNGAAAAIATSDIVFGNDTELAGLAGLSEGDAPAVAARTLLATMPRTAVEGAVSLPAVVHKQGSLGATVYTTAGAVHISASEVEVVDTVGAGDTLAGTVVASLLGGADWAGALALGVAAATLSTRAAGGTDGQPLLADASSLAARLPVEHRSYPIGGAT